MSTQSDLAELYTAFFNRAPDSAGLAYWVNQLNAGTISLNQIAKNWVESQPEGQAKYPAGMSTTDFVNAIYGNVLSRTSDTDGLAYWKAQLDAGTISRDTFVATVINGAKSNTSTQGKADAALLSNKASVGIAFADKGLNDTALAAKVLTSVNADSNSLSATLALLKLVPSSAAGQTTAVLNSLSTALGNVATLIKTAPADLGNLATYLNAVLTGVTSNTNLDTLFTSINTKVVAAQTNPSALADAANQGANDASTATPSAGGGGGDTPPPVTTPTFTAVVTDSTLKISGTATSAVTVDLDKGIYNHGSDVTPSEFSKIDATGYAGAVTVSGTLVQASASGFKPTINHTFAIVDTLEHIITYLSSPTSPEPVLGSFSYSVTDTAVSIPVTLSVVGAAQANGLYNSFLQGATNHASLTAKLQYTVEDTAVNLTNSANASLVTKQNLLVDGPASVAQVKALNQLAGEGHTVVYDEVADTYTNLSNPDNALLLSGKAVSITDAVSVSQAVIIQAIDDVDQVTINNLSDTAAHLDTASSGTLGLASTVSFSNAPTIAQLTSVAGKTDATLAYTSVTDLALNLVANEGGFVKGAVNVTVSDTASLTQLAAIDLETTGTLTATDIADSAVALVANAGGYVKAGVNVTVNDAATLAQVKSIDEANGTGGLTVDNIADDAALLAANLGSYVKAGVNVTVNDAASVSQLTTIDGLNGSGLLVYTAVSDIAATLVTNTGNYVTGTVNVTVSDAATLAQLSTIHLKTTGTLTANLIQDGVTALTANIDGYVKDGVSITVTDAATIAQLTSLDSVNGTGSVTATSINDIAEHLAANTGGYIKGAVNVSVSDPATIAQLTAIDNANGAGTLTYTALSDTSSNLLANITGTGTHYVISGKNVTVTDAVSLQTLASIDSANGAGTLTADNVIDSADKLLADTPYLSPTTHVEIQGAVSLADLKTIDDKSGVVVYNDIADDIAALVADTNSDIGGSVNVTVNDAASIADLAAIHIKTTGTLTYTSITDDATALAVDAALPTGFIKDSVAITVTGQISLAELHAISLKTSGELTYLSITDTAAHLVADTDHYINGDVTVTVDGAIALSDLVTLSGKSASVDYSDVTGTAVELATDALSNAGEGTFVIHGKHIEVTDAATVQQLADIKSATGLDASFSELSDAAAALATDAASVALASTVTVTDAASLSDLAVIKSNLAAEGRLLYTAVEDTASNLLSNTGHFVGGTVNVTVSSSTSVADLAGITVLTSGTVTAAILEDTAQNLFSSEGVLTSYVAKGSSVTVGGDVTIAELKALVAKTEDAAKVHYTSISDTLDNLSAEGAAAYIKNGISVTVTDESASIAQLSAIDVATGDNLSYLGAIEDTAEALATDAALNSGAGKYTAGKVVTVSDAATLLQLATINAAADDVVYTKVSDTALNLAQNTGLFIKSGTQVTVQDAATISQLTAIDSYTDEALTYTKITDNAAQLLADGGHYVKGSVTVTVSDTGSVAASTLNTIDSETTTQVNASLATAVTGNFADVSTAFAATGIKLSGSESLSITDTAANLAGKSLAATTSTSDVLNVGLASVTTDLSHLTGFETINLEGSNRFTNKITIGDGDGVSVHAQAAATVVLGQGHQSFYSSVGNDTVTVNAGSTFVFASTAAANGTDLITNFTTGSTGSSLDFSSFIGLGAQKGYQIVNDTSDFGGGANQVTLLDGTSGHLATKNAVSVADFTSGTLSTVNGKEVIVAFDNAAHSANVYFVNSAGGGAANVVDNAADITLVGTINYTGSISGVADLNVNNHFALPV